MKLGEKNVAELKKSVAMSQSTARLSSKFARLAESADGKNGRAFCALLFSGDGYSYRDRSYKRRHCSRNAAKTKVEILT
jgi:hypothetical protein